MSDSIFNIDNHQKKEHTQGTNWDVAGRYDNFGDADNRRHQEIEAGKLAKIQHLSNSFVVKIRTPLLSTSVKVIETVTDDIKKERGQGKQKRQDRNGKRNK